MINILKIKFNDFVTFCLPAYLKARFHCQILKFLPQMNADEHRFFARSFEKSKEKGRKYHICAKDHPSKALYQRLAALQICSIVFFASFRTPFTYKKEMGPRNTRNYTKMGSLFRIISCVSWAYFWLRPKAAPCSSAAEGKSVR